MLKLKTPSKKEVQLVKEFLITQTKKEPLSIKLENNLVSIMIDKDDYDYKLSTKLREEIKDTELKFFCSIKEMKEGTFLRFNLYKTVKVKYEI